MKALITGITGMTGSHLAEFVLGRGTVDVHGTTRWQDGYRHISGIAEHLTLHDCDLTDAAAIRAVIKAVRPDQVYHLAAETSVANSWRNPGKTILNNITCQLNLLEAVKEFAPRARLLVTGSSESYGMVRDQDLPVTEGTGFNPLSPYGVSKVSQDVLAFQYHKSYGMDIVRVRVFNLTGPRQSDTFALSSFARQLAMISSGRRPPVLRVGNLSACRDFTDFRDAAQAYWLALEQAPAGEVYNIGSGNAVTLDAALSMLVILSGLHVTIQQDPQRMRPSDIPVMIANPRRFSQATGWQPRIPFRQTLSDLLDYWKEELEKKS